MKNLMMMLGTNRWELLFGKSKCHARFAQTFFTGFAMAFDMKHWLQTALCLVHDTTGPHLEFENEVAENELIQEMATYLSQMRDLCAHLGGVCDVDKISKFRVVRTKLEERMDSLYDKIKHTRRKHTVLMAHANSSVCTCYSTEYNRAFADLPLEMTLRIFKYLDVFTLGKARQ